MIFLNADAIHAPSISKSRKDSAVIEFDVRKSSKDPAISTSLIHDTVSSGVKSHAHFGLEADTPVLKVVWVWEFAEMQFRESISRSFHRTILRISFSSTTRRIPGIKILGNSGVSFVELCGSRLTPSPCLMAIPGKNGEFFSGAGGFSKTHPEVPKEFGV